MARQLAKTTARGYGKEHVALRKQYKQRMARGETFICWRCGLLVDPASPWELGHDDHDRTMYRGPEHRGRECPKGGNRATAGRRRKPSAETRRWKL